MRSLTLFLLSLICSSALGQSDAAIEQFNQGVELHDQGKFDEEIEKYSAAITLDPKFYLAYYNRGCAWDHKREYDKAIADYDDAIRLDPKKAMAYMRRGRAWGHKRDYDKAIADFNDAIRLNPKDAEAYMRRGGAWAEKKEFYKAIVDFNDAITLQPTHKALYVIRGNVWSDKGVYDIAITDYSEAIRLDPEYAAAYNHSAWLLATCPVAKYRNGAKALVDATSANELSLWKNAYYLGTLAAAYAELGEFDKAIEYQEKAIRLETNEVYIQGYRSRLELYKSGKPYREELKN